MVKYHKWKKSKWKRNPKGGIFPPFPPVVKSNGKEFVPNEDDEIFTYNFGSGSEGELDVICNVMFVLHIE